MPLKTDSVLDLYTKRDFEVDEELDLLAEEDDEDLCPACGTSLIELPTEAFALQCPACNRLYR